MKKTGIICAALLGSAVAVRAQQAPPAVPPNHPYSPNQDKTTELAGKLNSVDSHKRSLTISLGSGQRQVVKLADTATITRDGATAALDQLKPGDDIRATYDPAAHLALTVTVQSGRKK